MDFEYLLDPTEATDRASEPGLLERTESVATILGTEITVALLLPVFRVVVVSRPPLSENQISVVTIPPDTA